MSELAISISYQPSPSHWGENANLSFRENGAVIHLVEDGSADEQIRTIKKAARYLAGLKATVMQLDGDWQAEHQWAFANSMAGPRSAIRVKWCDNDDKAGLEKRFEALMFARELVNSTPEDLSPEALANRASEWLSSLAGEAITCRRWTGEELADAGWVGIYHVGRGSSRPPVLLEVDFNPSGTSDTSVSAALVGKGITFDSGGYSIKSSEGMLDMKCDMGGAATVTAALGLAIMNGLSKRVKLFLCCAENLISGHAYKLGDVMTYKNGISVEIVNTDAEGRLVLADGLLAAGETGASLIIDAATLTGAAVAATGGDYDALFGLDQELQQKIVQIAKEENERVWPLPLEIWHQEKCPSNFADTANSRPQKGGGAGGASNAAGFLSRFVPENGKGWVHMDLAGAYNSSATAMMPAGATGSGIRTIARAIID